MDDDFSLSQLAVMPRLPDATSKFIQDSVHKICRFSPLCVKVMDTREWQRLRSLRQLGLTNYIYPCAVHTRAEHSMGVCSLANEFADRIYRGQRAELGMTEMDVECVSLAGLCHDLGHGPFSHVFEYEFLKKMNITDWVHEDMSCQILDLIMENPRIPDNLLPDEVDRRRIKTMIDPPTDAAFSSRPDRYLYDIVANHHNSIDVDKFDYLKRDSMLCGIKIGFDAKRAMIFSKVIGNEICFKSSEYMPLLELFRSRERMHRQVYTHKKTKIIEFMVSDAMFEANARFRFDEKIRSAKTFLSLDDSIMNRIQFFHEFHDRETLDDREQRGMDSAQAILKRLHDRDMYQFINAAQIPHYLPSEAVDQIIRMFTSTEIMSCYSGNGASLNAEDIITSVNKINFSMNDKNPMEYVKFFTRFTDTYSRPVSSEETSEMLTPVFQERSLRLYSRNGDLEVCRALEEAFQSWIRRHLGPNRPMETPRRFGQMGADSRPNHSNGLPLQENSLPGGSGKYVSKVGSGHRLTFAEGRRGSEEHAQNSGFEAATKCVDGDFRCPSPVESHSSLFKRKRSLNVELDEANEGAA
ncbi:hypothetical protein CEUSTIGMA_g5912.t1 [Chlamydomonas eustigma]|uniref:HD/PDEase domain-containing protein n=1 Tax=Chlamydomonas eustigma TaxID=1157962 RepID=A0A250X5W6_9CHLO|nr:hypothetical protein CEUSTIGMA_g5912.t1 [Chlamydomonas eustigma]|eukprot:GAX78473.1 hypothetical protein CEUSTIGMA_g5912.t1 [Chlamydomonas eustigma]